MRLRPHTVTSQLRLLSFAAQRGVYIYSNISKKKLLVHINDPIFFFIVNHSLLQHSDVIWCFNREEGLQCYLHFILLSLVYTSFFEALSPFVASTLPPRLSGRLLYPKSGHLWSALCSKFPACHSLQPERPCTWFPLAISLSPQSLCDSHLALCGPYVLLPGSHPVIFSSVSVAQFWPKCICLHSARRFTCPASRCLWPIYQTLWPACPS